MNGTMQATRQKKKTRKRERDEDREREKAGKVHTKRDIALYEKFIE